MIDQQKNEKRPAETLTGQEFTDQSDQQNFEERPAQRPMKKRKFK